MPRRTHPPDIHRHARGYLREQRSRAIVCNWQRLKALWATSGLAGHPEEWKTMDAPPLGERYARPSGHLVRNPFNRCSCELCSRSDQERRRDRRRERRRWRSEFDEQFD